MAAPLASRADRYQQGKALRQSVPRAAHGDFKGPLTRDPMAVLAESDPARVADLVPVRYQRMGTDAFAFLRGAAAIMAEDLRHQPMVGLPVQAGGDCHLMNFGAFGTPEDRILFDMNDFDETLPGVDFTVDVKRLAASVAVAALHAGFSRHRSRAMVVATVQAYHHRMVELARLSPLEVWYTRVELVDEIARMDNRSLKRKLTDIIAQTRGKLHKDDNFPHLVSGPDFKIADKPPTIFHIAPLADPAHKVDVDAMFASYFAGLEPAVQAPLARYQRTDFAFKAVGVGSVGTFCAIGLYVSGDGDPLFLQVKQAMTSVLERLSRTLSFKGTPGQRVVQGQRMLQAASDVFLGVTEDVASNRSFYVRQLKNRRLGGISELVEEEALQDYAALCGRTLARAHGRSGDPAQIAGYLGKSDAFADAIGSFAMAYADQTKLDFAALLAQQKRASSTAQR